MRELLNYVNIQKYYNLLLSNYKLRKGRLSIKVKIIQIIIIRIIIIS